MFGWRPSPGSGSHRAPHRSWSRLSAEAPGHELDFLQKTHDACIEIRQPKAFRQAGYYPTQYCMRQDGQGKRTVSLERFSFSQAS